MRIPRLLILPCLVLILTGSCAAAENNMTRSIKVDGPVESGALISLEGSAGKLANLTTANRLVGVTGNQGLIDIGEAGGDTVSVITSGATPTLVSDVNGPVADGDRITASPMSGIGMKATESGRVVGVALQGLDDVAGSVRSITNKDGKQVPVKIGLISVQVGPTDYAAKDNNTSRVVPALLQNGLNAVAGKQVSAVRTIVALAVMVIGFIVAAILMATSIRTSITAIGRNPLAAGSVRHGLWQVIVTGLAIIAAGVISAYLLILV